MSSSPNKEIQEPVKVENWRNKLYINIQQTTAIIGWKLKE